MNSNTWKLVKVIKDEALAKGLELKLQELNEQRERILQLLEGIRPKPVIKAKPNISKTKKPHWTQMPENRAKVIKQMRRAVKIKLSNGNK